MGNIRGTHAVVKALHAQESHTDDAAQQVPGTLAIKGVPSPKTMSWGWQRLLSPTQIASTSGSWGPDGLDNSMSFGRLDQEQVLEVVPKGHVLKTPQEHPFMRPAGGSSSGVYGSRSYLTHENMRPVEEH